MTVTALPRRDREARELLDNAARVVRPVVLARDRVLPVTGRLGELLPGAAVQRGATVVVDGAHGAGVTSVTLLLARAATAVGEWAAAVDLEGTLGGLAVAEHEVVLERFAVVRRVPPARWAAVVAALLDGVSLVLTATPPHVRAGDARRLAARARERGVVLVATGRWPAEATLRLTVDTTAWSGLDAGGGLLGERELAVQVDGRGVAARRQKGALARAG